MYYGYLIALQKEYLELIEFYFDEEFYTEVLSYLHPAERYCLCRRIHDQPTTLWRKEAFRFEMDVMSGNKMPHGLFVSENADAVGNIFMKSNYDTRYCDQVAPGETRNCQDLAAQENYKKKAAENEVLPIYSIHYSIAFF